MGSNDDTEKELHCPICDKCFSFLNIKCESCDHLCVQGSEEGAELGLSDVFCAKCAEHKPI